MTVQMVYLYQKQGNNTNGGKQNEKTIKTEDILNMASIMVESAIKHEQEGSHELALTEARIAYQYQGVLIDFAYKSGSDFSKCYDEVVEITKINKIARLVNEVLDRVNGR